MGVKARVSEVNAVVGGAAGSEEKCRMRARRRRHAPGFRNCFPAWSGSEREGCGVVIKVGPMASD